MKLNKIYQGDALQVLKTFPDNLVDTIITSPPYWGLRDYGVKGQIGLEKTLDEFLSKLLKITFELKRVLKPTGVMFWNHGDCYLAGKAGKFAKETKNPKKEIDYTPPHRNTGIAKCLALQNYRLILKMIDEQGWILRNTVVWWKPNAMPSSVKDRFSNTYEPIFMLVKKKKYWFDLDAVRVPHKGGPQPFNLRVRDAHEKISSQYKATEQERKKYTEKMAGGGSGVKGHSGYYDKDGNLLVSFLGKNPGDVWRITTQPFPEAHFATFPEKLIIPMIKSSCPRWICQKCGKARVRIIKVSGGTIGKSWHPHVKDKKEGMGQTNYMRIGSQKDKDGKLYKRQTLGWTDCGCRAGWKAGIVLDPFMGSGTTAKVARHLGRRYLGIELSKDYIKIAERRLQQQRLDI